MNSFRSRREATGETATDTERQPTCPLRSTSSRRSAATSAPSSCAPRARRTCSPTSACSSRAAGPVVEMEGAERIMLGSNNYLGLTADPRVMQGARDALERYGTGLTGSRFLNGTIDLHLELEARARRVDGHGGGDRLHDGPPGQRRHARDAPGPRRHGDRRLGRPRLDPRRLPAVAREAAPVPPRPARQAREDARARRRRRRRRPRRRRRRLLDGGRRRRPAADRRALQGPRRAADGRRGPRRRRARRPRRRRERAARRRARRRPADGDVLEVAGVLRRLHRRDARGDRLPARLLAGVHVHGRRRARRRRRRPGRPAHHPLRRGAAALRPRAGERRLPERGARRRSGSR